MATTARSSGPETRKGRVVATRPLTNYVNNSDIVDTQSALRMQRLRLLGIIGARANVLADLAWGRAA